MGAVVDGGLVVEWQRVTQARRTLVRGTNGAQRGSAAARPLAMARTKVVDMKSVRRAYMESGQGRSTFTYVPS